MPPPGPPGEERGRVKKGCGPGPGTLQDRRHGRKASGFGPAVTEGRAGLVTFLEPARSCSFFVWAVCGEKCWDPCKSHDMLRMTTSRAPCSTVRLFAPKNRAS